MYALPPVAVSGVLDRLRAPVTVTGRHGRMEACLQFEPSVFIIAVAHRRGIRIGPGNAMCSMRGGLTAPILGTCGG